MIKINCKTINVYTNKELKMREIKVNHQNISWYAMRINTNQIICLPEALSTSSTAIHFDMPSISYPFLFYVSAVRSIASPVFPECLMEWPRHSRLDHGKHAGQNFLRERLQHGCAIHGF